MRKLKILLLELVSGSAIEPALIAWMDFKRFVYRHIPGRVESVQLKLLRCKPRGQKMTNIKTSPPYVGMVSPTPVAYTSYLRKNGVACGYPTHFNLERLNKLAKEFNYLEGKYSKHHIVVVIWGSELYILDGMHRAAICAVQKLAKVDVKIVSPFWLLVTRGYAEYSRCKRDCRKEIHRLFGKIEKW